MPNILPIISSLFVYVLLAQTALAIKDRRAKAISFCAVNLAGFMWISLLARYSEWESSSILSLGFAAVARHIGLITFYVLTICVAFYLMRRYATRQGWLPWLAFFYPISLLVVFRYMNFLWEPLIRSQEIPDWVIAATIIGLSYMAFRLSYLVLEVRNGSVQPPSLSEYLGFAFFLPTLVIGPISPFSMHQRSFDSFDRESIPVTRSIFRILVGATKYLFLASLANQLSYSGIFQDGRPHGLLDLGIASVFYYLYLYCNFSGFCDMGIGLAGLTCIRVKENFNNPFAAKNLKDFWNRWHISLSEYTRDVIFAPLSKSLIKRLGPKYTNLSISVGIFCVFLAIGIWHGVGLLFVLFGVVQAIGVITNHYYTIWLKRTLGKERYKAYNENPAINAAATILTFAYVAASLALFANNREMIGVIKNAMVLGL